MSKKIPHNTKILMCITFVWMMFIGFTLWPTSFWLEVKNIKVHDVKVGEPIIMEVDRTIHRPFYADWNVTVRKEEGEGYVINCLNRAATDYRIDAKLPNPVTLDWWSNGACSDLKPGYYIITTSWDIRPDILGLPKKSLVVESNVFKVKE